MAKINSRSKGNRSERTACKFFKGWTGKEFSRTPSSGGLQWKKANVKGDIICTEEGHYFPFSVEVKNYKDLNFEHLLYDVKSDIMKFWSQCVADSLIANKAPMLLMRYNGMPKDLWFVMLPEYLYHEYLSPFIHVKEEKLFIIPYHGVVVLTTNTLGKVSYKKIRKPIKLHYLNEK